MGNWNGIDFLIFLIFFVNTLLGMSRGATKEIISLMTLSVALIFVIRFTMPMATFFGASPMIGYLLESTFVQRFSEAVFSTPLTREILYQITYSISILICFVGVFGAGEMVLNYTGVCALFPFPIAFLNRKIGVVLGSIRGYVFGIIFVLVLEHAFAYTQGSWFINNILQTPASRLDILIQRQNLKDYQDVFKNKDLYNSNSVFRQIEN